MEKKKVLVIFGTRPEAIKMCPLVLELRKRSKLDVHLCVTGQHREMLQQVLDIFKIVPEYDLAIMQPGQTLFDITARVLTHLRDVLLDCRPAMVFVHGDTTTAFSAALAAYYLQIPVAHVEAGLRTGNLYSPFPEEYNRQAIGLIAAVHFAPTQQAKENLLREGKPSDHIYITGNTGIDALQYTVRPDYQSDLLRWTEGSRLLLITAHRRENLGDHMHQMFHAIRRILDAYPDTKAIYPMHMNPQVRNVADAELHGCDSIRLIDPLDVVDFHNLMSRCYLILTDSGGIQEEAPALGKPVLVMRDTTERPEGVAAGTLWLVGTEESSIYSACAQLLDDPVVYAQMSQSQNPYGNGDASQRIADVVEKLLF